MWIPWLLTALLSPEQDTSPSVVVILADDMGYSDIGCYGGEIRTPNLDRLAEGGLRWTQFYNGARCCPTRASLLTGLYAHQAGVGWMMADSGTDAYRGELSPRTPTLAEALAPAGYATYMSGKWHVTRGIHADSPRDNWPLARGFDAFFGTIHGAGSFFDPNALAFGNELIPPAEDFYYTDAIGDYALRFLREHEQTRGEDPFFLYLSFTAPHWPMHAKPEDIAGYSGRYDGGWDQLRAQRHARMQEMGLVSEDWPLSPRDPRLKDWEDTPDQDWHAARMEVYAAMVDNLDQNVGRVIDTLEDMGRLETTLILFLADNGGCAEEFGSRGPRTPDPEEPFPTLGPEGLQTRMVPRMTRDGKQVRSGYGVWPGPAESYVAYGLGWANASNTPFRSYKHWVHEGGIASPLIAHWPAGIRRRGELEHQPAHIIDLMATCLDLAGADYPAEHGGGPTLPLEGQSLRPHFEGKALDRGPLFWEHEGNRAVRDGDLKLVARGVRGPWELYDLSEDRTETKDLAQERPKDVQRLAALWDAWAERVGATPLTPYWKPRER